jgi:hypothetical protein
MLARTIALAVLTVGASQAALADDTAINTPSTRSNPSAQPTATQDSLPQELHQQLEQAGYKNIEIVPGSYLVSAQDPQGNTVMVRIGPTSMTVLTEATASGSSTTGSNSNSDGSNNYQSQNHAPGNSPASGGSSAASGDPSGIK